MQREIMFYAYAGHHNGHCLIDPSIPLTLTRYTNVTVFMANVHKQDYSPQIYLFGAAGL